MNPVIRLDPEDNVATALRPLAVGEDVMGTTVREPIRRCHKIALAPIAAGEEVRRYGHVIGAATSDIEAGAHVHVHNMASLRARQDG